MNEPKLAVQTNVSMTSEIKNFEICCVQHGICTHMLFLKYNMKLASYYLRCFYVCCENIEQGQVLMKAQ